MTDPYEREERIAIRQDSHIANAVEITDEERSSLPALKQRIKAMELNQRNKSRPLTVPRPVISGDRKLLAAGE